MPQREVIQTSTGELRFEFVWTDSPAEIEQLGLTFGELAVWLGGRVVWGDSSLTTGDGKGIAGLWIELLEYLSDYWLYLVLEQGYPFSASPGTPSQLDEELGRRWRNVADDRMTKEEETVYAFKMSHNLAEAAPGALRPDVWFVRDGGQFTIEARSTVELIVERLPDHEVKHVLTGLGEAIAQRCIRGTDSRTKEALKRWSGREARPLDDLARIASGLPKEYLWQTCASDPFDAVFADPDSSWVDDNVYVDLAYRCKGDMPPNALRTLFDKIRAAPAGVSPQLHSLTHRALAQLANVENTLRWPYQQGHALARWLRSDIGNLTGRIEPESLLATWDVAVGSHDFSTTKLDAVAYWAHARRPAVLWNTSEKHRGNEGARRATLAHEICHLLVDRSQTLPLAAVVGGAMERRLEQRANAFAAELLCPRQEAGAEYNRLRDVGVAIDNLTRRFGVSKELASLNLAQSDVVEDPNHQREVESHFPPGAFYPWDRGWR